MSWLGQLFSRRHRYDELSESIREHLDEKIEDMIDHGMTREEAERKARREFGNVTLTERDGRAVWRWSWIEDFPRMFAMGCADCAGILDSPLWRFSPCHSASVRMRPSLR